MSGYGGPQPGWYQDPQQPWQLRYWDGASWTAHTAPSGPGPGPGGVKVVPPLPFAASRAEFGRRALGYVLDWLVIGLPLLVVFVAAIFAVVASSSTADDGSGPSFAFLAVLLPLEGLFFFIPFLYNGFFTSGGRRTVGQRVAGLRVVDAMTGAPLSVGKGFLRAVVAAVASGQLFGLGYWWALWDGEHRTWHDMASSSVVIDVREAPPRPAW